MRKFKISQSIAKGDSDSIARYLNEIGRIDLLDAAEEAYLASKIRNGDQAALHLLVKSNLRFVVSVAKRYQDKGLKLEDLISEGNMGLIKAAQRFDATKGFKFITFAVWWIRQAIMVAIAEQRRVVRLPGNQLVGIAKLHSAGVKLEQELERPPTIEELAAYSGLTEDKVIDYTGNARFSYSLDRNINDESGISLMDVIVNKDAMGADQLSIHASLSIDLNRALSVLPQREQKIILLFYGMNGHPQTPLEDMQGIFNLSKERIRQLKDKAHRTLGLSCRAALVDYFSRSV
jgi:RNA polymerase primary sigma factor